MRVLTGPRRSVPGRVLPLHEDDGHDRFLRVGAMYAGEPAGGGARQANPRGGRQGKAGRSMGGPVLLPRPPGRERGRRAGQPAISIFLPRGLPFLGRWIRSTPSWNSARTLLSSTRVGSVKERWKDP
jgi:hypothetical protein